MILIGKIIILSFSDVEEHIIDKLKSIIQVENSVKYVETTSKSELVIHNLKIYLKEQKVCRNGKIIPLSNQEFLVLQFLVEHPGWIRTKEELYNVVNGDKIAGNVDNIIYCIICSLRKKLEKDSRHPEYIQTVRNVGYKFVVPSEQEQTASN